MLWRFGLRIEVVGFVDEKLEVEGIGVLSQYFGAWGLRPIVREVY